MGSEDSIDRQLTAYDYSLPSELIAQTPVTPRDHSRLMVVGSQGQLGHHIFADLPHLLKPGDLLVVNNTRVIPARLYGKKVTFGADATPQFGTAAVEVFLLEEQSPNRWLTLVRPGRRLKPGTIIQFGPTLNGAVVWGYIRSTDEETGGRVVDFMVSHENTDQHTDVQTWISHCTNSHDTDSYGTNSHGTDSHGTDDDSPFTQPALWSVLPDLGEIPLPPYISNPDLDAERYQTVYSDRPGAVAAPTAGLHFTTTLFDTLEAKGINRAFLTLHVGVGTFRPVESDNITAHQMHEEWIDVPESTVAAIQATKQQGGRVIAVGTTVTRALEGAATQSILQPYQGKTNIFIYPGYEWRVIDGLITNFHLPKSSLMMMVSALIGRKTLLAAYDEAIRQQYRFYSLGDAMLLLP